MHPSDQDWPRCACGCGEPVPVRKANCTARGYVKGEPCRFVAGHSSRVTRKLPVNGMVQCYDCGITKATSDFNVDSTRPSGLDPCCRACQKARYRRANPNPKYRRWPNSAVRARAYAAARRARLRGQFVEHVDALVVYTRDGGICGICGEPVEPAAFDVDHVIPLAKGGEHSYANVQAAHPSCNYSKKDRINA
jgi:5-methylcytosine-specific restriction endonuclease McrA